MLLADQVERGQLGGRSPDESNWGYHLIVPVI